MTTVLPTAAEALAEAVKIARDVTLALTMAERGKLWIAIANELREAADARSLWGDTHNAADEFAEQAAVRAVNTAGKLSPDPGAPAPRGPIPPMLDERLREVRRPADLRFGGAVPAAGVPTPEQWDAAKWAPGDTSECVHCHTPITLTEIPYQQQTYGNGGEPPFWQHKYTGQRVCASAPTGDTMTDLDATAVHTFATPPILDIKR